MWFCCKAWNFRSIVWNSQISPTWKGSLLHGWKTANCTQKCEWSTFSAGCKATLIIIPIKKAALRRRGAHYVTSSDEGRGHRESGDHWRIAPQRAATYQVLLNFHTFCRYQDTRGVSILCFHFWYFSQHRNRSAISAPQLSFIAYFVGWSVRKTASSLLSDFFYLRC